MSKEAEEFFRQKTIEYADQQLRLHICGLKK